MTHDIYKVLFYRLYTRVLHCTCVSTCIKITLYYLDLHYADLRFIHGSPVIREGDLLPPTPQLFKIYGSDEIFSPFQFCTCGPQNSPEHDQYILCIFRLHAREWLKGVSMAVPRDEAQYFYYIYLTPWRIVLVFVVHVYLNKW